jgi:hypothetical protein
LEYTTAKERNELSDRSNCRVRLIRDRMVNSEMRGRGLEIILP